MFASSLLRAWCLGTNLWTVFGQRPNQGQASVASCWTCNQSPGCFECISKINNSNGTYTIELDFRTAKETILVGRAALDWLEPTVSSTKVNVMCLIQDVSARATSHLTPNLELLNVKKSALCLFSCLRMLSQWPSTLTTVQPETMLCLLLVPTPFLLAKRIKVVDARLKTIALLHTAWRKLIYSPALRYLLSLRQQLLRWAQLSFLLW